MTRHCVADLDDHLHGLECPPHLREALAALRDHIATCGPVRWRGHEAPEGWSLTVGVGGHVICYLTFRLLDSHLRVRVRDTEPGEGIRARIAHAFSEAQRNVLVSSLESVTALFPRITQAYVLAKARPLGARPTPSSHAEES